MKYTFDGEVLDRTANGENIIVGGLPVVPHKDTHVTVSWDIPDVHVCSDGQMPSIRRVVYDANHGVWDARSVTTGEFMGSITHCPWCGEELP